MTLNGRTALYCTNDASVGAHHGNYPYPYPYYQRQKYKVLADIRGVSVAIFSNFGHHIFGTFRVEANIIGSPDKTGNVKTETSYS